MPAGVHVARAIGACRVCGFQLGDTEGLGSQICDECELDIQLDVECREREIDEHEREVAEWLEDEREYRDEQRDHEESAEL